MIRRPIYEAIAAHFAAVPGFATVTRDPKHWKDVAPENCPALLLRPEGEEQQEVRKGLPPRWALSVSLLVYVRQGGEEAADTISDLLDAVEAAQVAEDQVRHAVSLAGLVSSLRIAGRVEIELGTMDGEAIVYIPLRVVAAG